MDATRQQAQQEVRTMLAMAGGDSDAVYRALLRAVKATRRYAGADGAEDGTYAHLFLALADITGNAAYRL